MNTFLTVENKKYFRMTEVKEYLSKLLGVTKTSIEQKLKGKGIKIKGFGTSLWYEEEVVNETFNLGLKDEVKAKIDVEDSESFGFEESLEDRLNKVGLKLADDVISINESISSLYPKMLNVYDREIEDEEIEGILEEIEEKEALAIKYNKLFKKYKIYNKIKVVNRVVYDISCKEVFSKLIIVGSGYYIDGFTIKNTKDGLIIYDVFGDRNLNIEDIKNASGEIYDVYNVTETYRKIAMRADSIKGSVYNLYAKSSKTCLDLSSGFSNDEIKIINIDELKEHANRYILNK